MRRPRPEMDCSLREKNFSFVTKGFENPEFIFMTLLLHVDVILKTMLLWKKSLTLNAI